MNWLSIWTGLTGLVSSAKDWSKQMRAVLWFILVVSILVGLLIALPRYDCKSLQFQAACESVERSYR